MKWHKIETAPKDGRNLLLWGNIHMGLLRDGYFVGYWSNYVSEWVPTYFTSEVSAVNPTHFQLLPAPPNATPHNVELLSNAQFRACRERMGLTPKELAGELGVTQSHIYRMEAGPETAQGVNVTRQMSKAIQLLEIVINARNQSNG